MEKSVELTLERIRLQLLLNNGMPKDELMRDKLMDGIKVALDGLYQLGLMDGIISELQHGPNSSKTL